MAIILPITKLTDLSFGQGLQDIQSVLSEVRKNQSSWSSYVLQSHPWSHGGQRSAVISQKSVLLCSTGVQHSSLKSKLPKSF